MLFDNNLLLSRRREMEVQVGLLVGVAAPVSVISSRRKCAARDRYNQN